MSHEKPYKILILEDDPRYSEPLKAQILQDDRFTLLGVTDSAEMAYKQIKTSLPDVVIVDLELSEGDGIELLDCLQAAGESLPLMPYLLVTTAFASESIAARLSAGLADYMFRKQNQSYSPEKVLKHLHIMSSQFQRNKRPSAKLISSSMETEKLMRTRIESELEQYYMSQSTQAKDYLAECIYQVMNLSPFEKVEIGKFYVSVGQVYKKESRNVDMAIRRLLSTAFLQTSPDDLERLYKPYVDIDRGAPRNKDFITYTANKIKKELNR